MTPTAMSGFETGSLGLPMALNPFLEGTPNHLVWKMFWSEGSALLKSRQLDAIQGLRQIALESKPNYLGHINIDSAP
jgi:hypothetical protein